MREGGGAQSWPEGGFAALGAGPATGSGAHGLAQEARAAADIRGARVRHAQASEPRRTPTGAMAGGEGADPAHERTNSPTREGTAAKPTQRRRQVPASCRRSVVRGYGSVAHREAAAAERSCARRLVQLTWRHYRCRRQDGKRMQQYTTSELSSRY